MKKETDNIKIGAIIKEARIKKKLTLRGGARLADMQPFRLSQIEAGKCSTTLPTFLRICRAFQIKYIIE
jgi:transcriptional regulator with XRE-family HTH domain